MQRGNVPTIVLIYLVCTMHVQRAVFESSACSRDKETFEHAHYSLSLVLSVVISQKGSTHNLQLKCINIIEII